MQVKRWTDIKAKKLSPEKRERLDREIKDEVLAMELRELRESAGLTQQVVAELADMTQAELSRIERRNDHMVSTLRKVLQAMGGDLEVVAVLGNKRVRLSGV